MRRNGPAYPLRSRRSRVASLTLTDPWGECDLLLRNPAMKGFPLLDTAIDGWYGFRPLDGAVLDGSDFGGPEEARTTASRLLLLMSALRGPAHHPLMTSDHYRTVESAGKKPRRHEKPTVALRASVRQHEWH